jgi:T5orf172 domain
MGIDISPSSVYVISHRPGYGEWLVTGICGTPKGDRPALTEAKIGHTSDLAKRRNSAAFQRGVNSCDLRIEFEKNYETAAIAKAAEKRLQARFTRKALGKEWFALSEIDILAIPVLVDFF